MINERRRPGRLISLPPSPPAIPPSQLGVEFYSALKAGKDFLLMMFFYFSSLFFWKFLIRFAEFVSEARPLVFPLYFFYFFPHRDCSLKTHHTLSALGFFFSLQLIQMVFIFFWIAFRLISDYGQIFRHQKESAAFSIGFKFDCYHHFCNAVKASARWTQLVYYIYYNMSQFTSDKRPGAVWGQWAQVICPSLPLTGRKLLIMSH